MKIKVKQTFGRRRVMGGAKILPGVYEATDPALWGLADELVQEGYAVVVSDDTPAFVPAPKPEVSKPVGPTHQEFENVTGRVAPERDETSLTTAPGGEVLMLSDDPEPEPLSEAEAEMWDAKLASDDNVEFVNGVGWVKPSEDTAEDDPPPVNPAPEDKPKGKRR